VGPAGILSATGRTRRGAPADILHVQ